MRLFPSRMQWRKWALPSKLSFLGSLMSIIGRLLSITTFMIQPRVSPDIERKIQELDDIKVAIFSLSTYVDRQQSSLKTLSAQKIEIEKERERIQKILQIDKEHLDAFLEYQLAQRKSRTWIETAISFFVGVLSSSVVTFTAIDLQKRLKSGKASQVET